jgi:hypothetical protein
MTTSTLRWLDFSRDEHNRIVEIIRLFSQPESRDELGIGIVRDTFSNLLFPGVTVVQTRRGTSSSSRGCSGTVPSSGVRARSWRRGLSATSEPWSRRSAPAGVRTAASGRHGGTALAAPPHGSERRRVAVAARSPSDLNRLRAWPVCARFASPIRHGPTPADRVSSTPVIAGVSPSCGRILTIDVVTCSVSRSLGTTLSAVRHAAVPVPSVRRVVVTRCGSSITLWHESCWSRPSAERVVTETGPRCPFERVRAANAARSPDRRSTVGWLRRWVGSLLVGVTTT